MSFRRLLLRKLFYHWRGNLAVLLGVALGTAVLTGALLVGDSLRGSLRDRTRKQLEWVDHAMIAGRFVRQELAKEVAHERLEPVLILQGAVSAAPSAGSSELPRRVGRVMVYGVDDHFWNDLPDGGEVRPRNGVRVNAALWQELGGADEITLHVTRASGVPRETLLGRRDAESVVTTLTVPVGAVIPDDAPYGRFNLNPTPGTPRIVFIPLGLLQEKLDLKGRVNALLARGGEPGALQVGLKNHLTLEDWNLVLHTPQSRTADLFAKLDRDGDGQLQRREWRDRVAETLARSADANGDGVLTRPEVEGYYRDKRGYLSLESRQMLLEPAVVAAALQAAVDAELRAAPTLVYLANWIEASREKVPYSIVAALDPSLPPPLGPFLPPGSEGLDNDEIILAGWEELSLLVLPSDMVKLTYFEPIEGGRLREATASFKLRRVVPIADAAADPDLTPEFPGITDKLDIKDWDPPFPYDNKRIKPRDERYWKSYRTTPKAYVSLTRGQQLWGNRFGNVTSIRLAPERQRQQPVDLATQADRFRALLLQHLKPEDGGLVFDSVRERALQASAGGSDFGVLFLSFSFFLIVAALLLVGLLFRLNLDRRASEVGLLLATGYRRRTVCGLLLAEGTLIAVIGGGIGLLLALLYSRLLLHLLRVLWPGGLEHSFLRPHATPPSLAGGFGASFAVSVLTILWAVLALRKVPPRALLAGETTAAVAPTIGPRSRWGLGLALVSALSGLGLLIGAAFVEDHEMRAMSFFGSGVLLLAAALAGTWAWMRGHREGHVSGCGGLALARLGARNAARHPARSLLTAGLLASAVFLLVAVESFRRRAADDFPAKDSGSGGFALLAESDLPVYHDLNSAEGRGEIGDAVERHQGKPARRRAEKTLADVRFEAFRVRAGDDASCLNLYQPRKPRLLGVPPTLIARGGFRFADAQAASPEDRANPWRLLNHVFEDGAVPVIGEANTVVWMLKSGLGKDIDATDERGQRVKLRVVGLLHDSVFQSGLLMAEANFLRLYPSHEGYNFFLIEAPPDRAGEVESVLELALGDRGFEVTPSARQLEAYLAVENTYLSTFQLLGGLGLLLGTLGLAVVLLRSVWERRGELALLRALGYRHRALGWLMLSENGFLLLLGLSVGTLTALLAVAPHLIDGQGEVPWPRLLGMLGMVLLTGLSTAALALAATLRAPLVPALRRE